MNDVKLQSPEGHPVDENLRPIKVGGKSTALETAQHGNGARVNGDLIVTGEIKGKTDIQIGDDITCDDITCDAITIDKDYSDTTAATIRGLHVDLDRTGTVSTGSDFATGIDLDVNQTGASGGTITSRGLDIDVTGDAGGTTNPAYGVDINVSGSDIATGITIDVDAGTAAKAVGIHIDNENGGTDFKNVSSAEPLDYFTINTIEDGETTLTTVESGVGSTANLNLDIDGDITLNSASGNFIAEKDGTEFSVANSAYAGMILGYTTDGIDAADDSYTLSTSFAVTDSAHKVKFVAPPSGVVEIFVSIFADTARRFIHFGLSDNATYNTLDVTHEHEVYVPGGTADELQINHYWVITGLTAGTAYEYWLGAKLAAGIGGVLRWGGNVTGEWSPFIMKATALPTAVSDYAVYG